MVTQTAPARTRRGRPGHDLESVLQGAVRVFNERGYDGTAMEDLSHELGISKSAIYHHVESKEQLLTLATDRALDALFALLHEVDEVPGSAFHRLEELVYRASLLLVHELPFVTLLLRIRGNTRAERQALTRRREFDRHVTVLVAQARDEGYLRDDIDPAVTARLVFGMVNSVVEWYKPRRADRVEDLAANIKTIAFAGIASAAGGRALVQPGEALPAGASPAGASRRGSAVGE
ncbi:MAG: TetR family transcriptional regulator [Austwickia sp.]|nr:TetR family transcriptional regulator [Austwickia sp.]